MFRCVNLLSVLGSLTLVSGQQICAGQDVSDEPELNAANLDGIWNTILILSGPTTFPSNAKFFFQHQGKVLWGLDWNVNNTGRCSFRKIQTPQIQNAIIGPFGVCVDTQAVLPSLGSSDEFLFILLTKEQDLCIFYRCAVRSINKVCQESPFIRVLSRKFSLNDKERMAVKRKLADFGIFDLNSLQTVDILSNECEVPDEADSKKIPYGKLTSQIRPRNRPQLKYRYRPSYRPRLRKRKMKY